MKHVPTVVKQENLKKSLKNFLTVQLESRNNFHYEMNLFMHGVLKAVSS